MRATRFLGPKRHNRHGEISHREGAHRRPAFAVLVLASQLLLMALAAAWCVHMVIIASNGRVYFAEPRVPVLLCEIIATALIAVFAGVVFFIQFRRL